MSAFAIFDRFLSYMESQKPSAIVINSDIIGFYYFQRAPNFMLLKNIPKFNGFCHEVLINPSNYNLKYSAKLI